MPTAATKPDERPILLIGGYGQIGTELRRLLSGAGPLVVAVRPAIHCGHVPYDLADLDLADPDQIRAVVRRWQPRLIINAAAYTAVDKAEAEPELAMAVNGIAPGVLAEEATKLNAGLIHYSTDYVFNGRGETPWQESDEPQPLNAYGRSKLAGEQAIQQAGCPHLILRTSWIYVANGVNFACTILRRALLPEPLRIVMDQIGAPTPARLVAEATARIVDQAGPDIAAFLRERGGIVHVACGGETSWYAFTLELVRLARAAGLPVAAARIDPVPADQYPTAARRPLNSRLDTGLLRQRFGIELPDWKAALGEEFPTIAASMFVQVHETAKRPRLVPDEPLPPYTYVPGRQPHPIRDPAGHSFGRHPPRPPTPDPAAWQQCRPYLVGLDLFNHGFYWEAHEVWESLWHACGRAGPMADFFKGLIKLAAAGVKVREGRLAGAASHGSRAAALFQGVEKSVGGAGNRYFGLSLHDLSMVAGFLSFWSELAMSPLGSDDDGRDVKIVFPFVLLPFDGAKLSPPAD